jgi:hypothetical protein
MLTRRRSRRRGTRRRAQKGGSGNPLYVLLGDGLGNRLFVYATAYALMKKTGVQLYLIDYDKNPHNGFDYRDFLEGIKLEKTPDVMTKVTAAPAIVPKSTRFYETFTENSINYDAVKKGATKMDREYYQNFGPLMPYIKDIKDMLMKKEFSKPQYAKLLSQLSPNETAFMHVRRGDYLKMGWVHEEGFYSRALSRMNDCKAVRKIIILSDDIQWCKGQIEKWKKVSKKPMECIDEPNELNTFYLMMNCKAGAILSSSTFGLWGAMLGPNENPSSCIIYPKLHVVYKKSYGENQPPNIHGVPDRWIAL